MTVCELTHECSHEVFTLVWGARTENCANIATVRSADHGAVAKVSVVEDLVRRSLINLLLVFIANTTLIGEGFGEPIGRADEGRFRVDVLMCCQCLGSNGSEAKMLTSALCC